MIPIGPENSGIQLIELCKEMAAERGLIVVSNRGPVEHRAIENGRLQARRGSGGLVTALSGIGQYAEFTWIACTMGRGDRLAMERAQGGHVRSLLLGPKLHLRFINPSRRAYHKYYNIFCNPLLWFLQHYMWNSPYTPNVDAKVHDAWQNGYALINQAFADAIIAEVEQSDPPPFVMLHDYHLYLVGGFVRRQLPNIILQHFTHIPWPAPSYWRLLPSPMRKAICTSLCANNIVGLQTTRDVHNFLHSCEVFVDGAEVDYQNRTIWLNGRMTVVNPYPISIDTTGLQRTARSLRVREYQEKLRHYCGEQTIVRVDRAEPSKNIVRGFRAFDILLQQYPDLIGKIKFLSFLVPTRSHIRQYQRYIQEINGVVETINGKYGDEEWQPIKIFYENNYFQAIAGMCLYDVLLVNAVVDGMNLVAKEGPTVNTRDGVVILSEAIGAYAQLKEYALSVAPTDLLGTAEALYAALSMDPEEKRRRASALKCSIEAEDLALWLRWQFEDLTNLARQQYAPAI